MRVFCILFHMALSQKSQTKAVYSEWQLPQGTPFGCAGMSVAKHPGKGPVNLFSETLQG